jgi:hypothetical protein
MNTKRFKLKKWQTCPLEAVKRCAEQYHVTRQKALFTDKYFWQYLKSLESLRRYIIFYGQVYRTNILVKQTKQNLDNLDIKIKEVRKIFG